MKDILRAVVFGGIFLLPFLPLYVENAYFFPYITGKNFAFRIIVEIVFAAWALLALFEVKYRPRFSWILATFASLLGVMLVANLQGENPLQSFWSNFERMEGYVTLVHVFMFTVVLGSVLKTEKFWSYLLHTSLVVAFVMAIYGLGQQSGVFEGGRGRVDSRLGNAAYMAVYMLFHIFFIYYLILKSKVATHRVLYAIGGVILAYTLLQTGTRGTFLGLAGGSIVTVAYLALFARKFPHLRRYAIGGVLSLVVLAGGFFVVREYSLIPDSSPMARIVQIDIKSDLQTRGVIWSIAVEGIKDKPLLGWGQGNFNYVFNQYYRAELYNKEQWFDRVHDIVLDWLIAGGVLGFLAYFSVMAAVVYYLFIIPVILKRESPFSVPEQAILLGLLVAYLLHNLVVFDNIISYIFYAFLLAMIHSRVGSVIEKVESWKIDERLITQFAAPIVIIVTGFTVYMVNVPGMLAAGDIIDALTEKTVVGRLQQFSDAIGRHSFADQEIIEQLAQQGMSIARNQQIKKDERDAFVQRTELELLRLEDIKPGDARVENFLASFYRTIGAVPEARKHAALAVEFSPQKPALIVEQALVELQAEKLDDAEAFLKHAYELAPENSTALVFYTSVLFRQGKPDEAKAIVGDTYKNDFANSDYAISSVQASEDFAYLAELFEIRVATKPDDAQQRASLAFIYYKLGQKDKAVDTLEQAASRIPTFATPAKCYISNIKANKEPNTPCTE